MRSCGDNGTSDTGEPEQTGINRNKPEPTKAWREDRHGRGERLEKEMRADIIMILMI